MPAQPLSDARSRKAIIALGNPGRTYRMTRHNLGFMVADRIGELHGIIFRRRYNSYYGRFSHGGHAVVIAKPRTYMNESGRAVTAIRHAFYVEPRNIMVVCDDINLPLARLRFRSRGSAGGHRGLESVTEALGTCEYARLRIGVGDPGGRDSRDYVLDRFTREEHSAVKEAVELASEALAVWISEGIAVAMNRFN